MVEEAEKEDKSIEVQVKRVKRKVFVNRAPDPEL